MPPSNQDGTVDVDTLPQMLMSRVDVVTGGASAVYGSDAVAGVVNFILDKKFDGFKYDINAGISKYGDAAEEKIGLAWGTELFGGRGHFEMAARFFKQDMVPTITVPMATTAIPGCRPALARPRRRLSTCPMATPFNQSLTRHDQLRHQLRLNNYTFNGAGDASPMTHGIPTTTAGLESGGDGGYDPVRHLCSKRPAPGEFFNRFSYDITDDINVYVQASWAESGNYRQLDAAGGQLGRHPAQHLLHQQPLSCRPRRASAADGGGHRGGQFRRRRFLSPDTASGASAARDRRRLRQHARLLGRRPTVQQWSTARTRAAQRPCL